MSALSEKDILKSIKESVEAETPDVWGKIQSTEKYKYDLDEKPLNSKMKRVYMPVAAVLFCVIIFAGLKMISFDFPNKQNKLAVGMDKGNPANGIITPGLAPDSIGRDAKAGAPEIFKPITIDADEKEAGRAFKIEIVLPSWMPEGFTKTSSKLYSANKDGSSPYMYMVEYSNPAKKLLTVSIAKFMTDEQKAKTQPVPMPAVPDKGAAENSAVSSKAVPANPPEVLPNVPAQSGANNPTQQAVPPVPAQKPSDTPTAQDGVIAGGSGSSAASTGTAVGGQRVSVDTAKVKIKNVDVTLTLFTSSGSNGTVSAFWVYNGGSYNISTDSISKDDVIKIVESMIK